MSDDAKPDLMPAWLRASQRSDAGAAPPRPADLINVNESFFIEIGGKPLGGIDKLLVTAQVGPVETALTGQATDYRGKVYEGPLNLYVSAKRIAELTKNAASLPKLDDTERQFYTDILGMINTMIARHHVAEQQLKRYIVKETVAASQHPADSTTGIMYGYKLDALNEILKAVDAIDDDAYSYQQRCAFGRLKLLAAAGPSVLVDDLPPGAVRGEALPEENVTKIREIGSPGTFTMPPCGDVLQRAQFVRRLGFDPKDHAGLDTWIFSPGVEAILATVVGRRDDAETRDAVRAKLFESYRAYRRDPSPNIDIEFQRDLPGFLSVYAAVAPPNGVPTCPDNLAEPTVGDAIGAIPSFLLAVRQTDFSAADYQLISAALNGAIVPVYEQFSMRPRTAEVLAEYSIAVLSALRSLVELQHLRLALVPMMLHNDLTLTIVLESAKG